MYIPLMIEAFRHPDSLLPSFSISPCDGDCCIRFMNSKVHEKRPPAAGPDGALRRHPHHHLLILKHVNVIDRYTAFEWTYSTPCAMLVTLHGREKIRHKV